MTPSCIMNLRRSMHYAKMSSIFQPSVSSLRQVPASKKDKDIASGLSKSQKLLVDTGLIFPASPPGTFHLLPLFMRALDKMVKLIDVEMQNIGCQKVSMPCLHDANLWKATGRYENMGKEMISFMDRTGKMCCLGPTHEETITSLLASTMHKPSYKRFPLRLYQVTPKFRDEMKPKHGLLRAKEFIMKDLYTFDCSEDAARQSYMAVCQAYGNILGKLNLPYTVAASSNGSMGGTESQEFLLPCETVGEDVVHVCQKCHTAVNQELLTETSTVICPVCKTEGNFSSMKAIEVAHAFLLGEHYSKIFHANFVTAEGKLSPLVMGCFGIGVTRLIASAIEVLSSVQEIIWPRLIAPYIICVIPPKAGSREFKMTGHLADSICAEFAKIPFLQGEVVLDDRDDLTIGRRLRDAKTVGFPLVVVIGKMASSETPKYELHCSDDSQTIPALELSGILKFVQNSEEGLSTGKKKLVA